MKSQPARKTNAIIDELNNYQQAGKWSSSLAQYFENEAYKVREADIAEGEMLLGVISGLNGNIEDMRKRFKNAMAYKPNDPIIKFNYGNSLFNNDFFSQAIQVLLPIAEINKDAALIIGLCCHALGLENKSAQYFEMAEVAPDVLQTIISKPLPESKLVNTAMDNVHASFTRDKEIWQSLSTR